VRRGDRARLLVLRELRLSHRLQLLARRRALGADPIAGEPDTDEADEDREDEPERRRGQREREQGAQHTADRADDAETEREPEVADATPAQSEAPGDRRRQD